MRRLAALVPNILGVSPGQRFRIESWASGLRAAGWRVDFHSFEDEALHEVLYRPGKPLTKATRLVSCYRRHLQLLSKPLDCDVVFVYREAALIGPAVLERLARRSGAPLLYDIDDPIFLPYRSPHSGWFSLLKFPGKTRALFRMSDCVLAINPTIAEYASRYASCVRVIPNFVDTEQYRPAEVRSPAQNGRLQMVWMGSASTMGNLSYLAAPLRQLQASCGARLRVVGVGSPDLPGVEFDLRAWSAAEEVAVLQDADVGIVPIPVVPWNRWKFFLKVVQFMAVGLPVVAQRVGSNEDVIQDGVNGFLVDTPADWLQKLELLARDPPLRRRLGAAARETAVRRYSREGQMPRVVSLFEAAAEGKLVGGPGDWGRTP